MIRFFENYSLKAHNTFGIDVKTRYFFEYTEPDDLKEFFESGKVGEGKKRLILGEGSNILFLDDFDGLVIRPNVPGIFRINEDRNHVWLEAGAGENWDEFVRYCVDMQLGGVENLSLIPGTVGAAPVQNIGAYGQEVCHVIELVRGFDIQEKKPVEFSAGQCGFAYRDSIFKRELQGRCIITSVIFKLNKFPKFKLDYGLLEKKVTEKGEISLENIKQAVNEIRSSKLPNVKVLGSAGSFFKNPEVDKSLADRMEREYRDMPVYPGSGGRYKLAAGWLVEQAGWKGYREGNAGVHDKQALVLVNYGGATGMEIFTLSEKIRQSVLEKFGVGLEREVNCI